MEKFWIKKDDKWILQSDKTDFPHNPDYNVTNLMKLSYTHTPELIHHLNYRFRKDNIYTNAGKILIAINPFKPINLYSKEIKEKYLLNNTTEPHIYQVVNEAILSNEKKQSFLISGESGSGKTETTKKILEYLANKYKDERNILPKLLEFNNLLEAFGNASTIRNHNSSRFGKYININIYNNTINAKLKTYLLEKVRLVNNLTNYHIFYSFGYEKNKRTYERDDWNTIYLQKQNLKNVWLSNGLSRTYWNDLENIINYLINILNGIYDDKIMQLMREKTIRTGGEIIKVELSESEGINMRDTIVMDIYSKLFDKVVSLINKQIESDIEGDLSYGILDIFGFEIFENNCFEQLCINYTNERLQSLFNRFVFEEEIKMFENEGILKTRVTFENNSHILDFFDRKPDGFFPLLDEKSIVGAKDNDLNLSLPDNKKVIKKKIDSFIINHYADNVEYSWGNFSNKNIEKYNKDIQEFLQNYYKSYGIFEEKERKLVKKKRGSVTVSTITSKFRNELSSLVDELSNSNLHFVRCIKPNDENREDRWEEDKIEAQLNYCGITSALELARQTFPIRMKKIDFERKYESLLEEYKIEELDGDNFLNGKTMVFYTNDMQNFLNEKLMEIQKILISKLVCIIKMSKYQKDYLHKIEKIIQIQNQIRNKNCRKELYRRFCILKLQNNWRIIQAKRLYNKRKISCIKIQKFIKNKYEEKNAKKIFVRFLKMILERQRYKTFIIDERQNVQNIIKQSIENEKMRLELHYEKQIKEYQQKIKELEEENNYLNTIETKYNTLVDTINTINSPPSSLTNSPTSSEEIFYEEKGVNVKMEDNEIMQELEDKVKYERTRYMDVQKLYDNIQIEYHNYKMQIKEAQILLGEKMLSIYNENMKFKDENMGLLREIKKLKEKKWYDKLIG